MLFDHFGTDRLIICLDPADILLLQDFFADRARVKLPELQCGFSDDYLVGHALRVGLAGERTPPEQLARLLPTIRYDMVFESDRIRDAGFPDFHRIEEARRPEENAAALSAFLSIPSGTAREIAATEYLSAD